MASRELVWDGFETGEEIEPYEVHITPEMVSRYLAGTDLYHPWFIDASPYGKPIAPPTVIDRSMAQTLFSQVFHLGGRGPTLHARQESAFLAPIFVGQTYTISGTVSDKYERRGKRYVGLRAICSDAQGVSVQTGHYIRMVSYSPGVAKSGTAPDEAADEQHSEPGPGGPLSPQWGVGHEVPPVAKLVSVGMMRNYTGGGMGFHTDYEAARRAGFEKPIAMGLQSQAFISEMLLNFFGKDWMTRGSISLAFIGTYGVADLVLARGAIRELEAVPEGVRRTLDVWLQQLDGTRVAAGTASCITPL